MNPFTALAEKKKTKKLCMAGLASIVLFALIAGCGKKDSARQKIIQRGPIESKWSKPYKAIQTMLYTPKPDWKVGESIEIRIKIKNTSESPYVFKKGPYKTINISRNGEAYGDEIGNDSLIASNDIIIKPGKIVDLRLTSVETERKFGIGGVGIYKFSGGLGGLPLPELEVTVK